MYKPPENNELVELKSHSNRSHNLDSQLIKVAELLARHFAKNDHQAANKDKENLNIGGKQDD